MSQANRQIEAHLQLGKRLHGSGRLAEAGQVYQQVLAAVPSHPDALHMMGVLLLQTGQPTAALGWIEQAIGIKGTVAEFHVHRAHALLALGRAAEAIEACHAALRLKRGNAEAHQALGHALTDTGDYPGALKAYQDAQRLKPDLPDVASNLGTAQHHANRLEDAARTLSRAAARDPRDPGVLVNLSHVLKDLGRFQEAEARLAAALRLAPGDPLALYNRALLLLLQGRFAEAWPGWEERFRAGAIAARGLTKPVWRGENLAGRTLLIHAEQGLGDTIQFCRHDFPRDGEVVFESQPRIARLLASRPGMPRIVRVGDPLPPHDLTCPLMSLPAIHGTTLDTIPSHVPYLAAEPGAVERWRTRLGDRGFRIGIAWQGNPARREDSGRSIRLEHYLGLAAVPGVRLISLQKDDGVEQLADSMTVESLGADFDSGPDGFIDSAAAMMSLDLVITSDTAMAHLAGALGRPVWVASRAVPDWRWMLERRDSPWYPSMRLFRQTARDDWAPVFAAMKDALMARLAGRDG
ncbi:MAG: tetratricopeptide repeat protein [Acetobacteraceae bacterium]|nr:tetratricopeptide repeat protein [Acetobacteraceae bacterium]